MSPTLGILEWFKEGEYERAEAAIADIHTLGFRHLRTGVSWADFAQPSAWAWYDWLLPRLARQFELLPCVTYVPPSRSLTGRTAGPPLEPKDFPDFLDVIVTRYGHLFETVELWNEPNNLAYWDWRCDPYWERYADMIVKAAYWMKRRGKRTLLGGMSPFDLNWLRSMAERNVLSDIDVIGLHGFPDTWESRETSWLAWPRQVEQLEALLARFKLDCSIWITEVGCSTWRHRPAQELDTFVEALDAPVERVYWYGYQDLDPVHESEGGWHFDERHYHFGLIDARGRPKLLHRLLAQGGLRRVRHVRDTQRRPMSIVGHVKPIVITGGAGFLGCNIAGRLASQGRDVLIIDSLAREGVEDNLLSLRHRHPSRISVAIADVRDGHGLPELTADAAALIHLAAQVAVTASIADPATDLEVNVNGTLQLLEALRREARKVPLIFASTNKVYGKLERHPLELTDEGWQPEDAHRLRHGFAEHEPLDFQSPYGCSKGAADQYVLDYARTFGLPAGVFRMSCLYGPHQLGTEEQGWVAHFMLSALHDRPITIFGDGHQVRDLLHVDDAVAAYIGALDNLDRIAGRAFNLGGGAGNAVSLLRVVRAIERLLGRKVPLRHADWRLGDQRYYVSDTRALERATDWRPQIGWAQGLERLLGWYCESAERGPPRAGERASA